MIEPAARDYAGFLVEVKARIRRGQHQALRAANAELVRLYWDIGEAIHRKQESLGWGRSVVETLARDLQAEFPGRNGFSARNLWNMRDLYLTYRDKPKLQPLVAEISWAKNLVVLGRCNDDLEREFSHHHLPGQERDRGRIRPPHGRPPHRRRHLCDRSPASRGLPRPATKP